MTRQQLAKLKEEFRNGDINAVEPMIAALEHLLPYDIKVRPGHDGTFQVQHRRYGPCMWGFTLKDGWGDYSSPRNPNNETGILVWAEPIILTTEVRHYVEGK
jgi:hypothetical protein